MKSSADSYDVVICGGGLAGLTLARQLSLQQPDVSVLILDKARGPLPEAALKVGESTVIIGAAYLQRVLELDSYLKECHIEKLGLRYYFPARGGAKTLADRPELGRSVYSPHTTEWQLDRGVLENDLRAMVRESGAELIEGVSVKDIELSQRGGAHQVVYRAGGQEYRVGATWAIDASGRNRLLHKKLGLDRPTAGWQCNSAWFRLDGRIDLTALVPESERAWHARVAGNHPTDASYGRYNSTNHLMGTGYWVWLIPLSSGYTSIGIVTLEDVHPFSSYNTFDKALAWLARHEPELAGLIAGREPLDFKVMKDYSLAGARAMSHERWACTGEAGGFPDPFYSPGTDTIGLANCMITEMIARDRRGDMTQALCESLNAEYLSYIDKATESIQFGYRFWGDPIVGAAKLLWDFYNFWLTAPRFFSGFFQPGFSDQRASWMDAEMMAGFGRALELRKAVHRLFEEWLAHGSHRASYEWLDYFGHVPMLYEGARQVTTPKETPRSDLLEGFAQLEEVAQALFLIALEDTMPEALRELEDAGHTRWLNAWAIGLDKTRWQADGLFEPRTDPRDLSRAYNQLRVLFRFG